MAIRSVVDENLWQQVKQSSIDSASYDDSLGFNMVRLRPNFEKWGSYLKTNSEGINYVITALMINDFNYSLESVWDTMEVPFDSGIGDIIGGFATMAGAGEMGSVFRSKKHWKKSGYLSISPTVRFIDVDGDGTPLKIATMLLQWATAFNESEMSKGITAVTETIRTGVTDVGARVAGSIPRNIANDSPARETLAVGVQELTTMGVAGVSNYLEDIGDLLSTRQTPPPLVVEIGKIFKHDDMVLTQVEFSFSKEVTEKGPMYVDATLSLSTRKIINTKADTGLLSTAEGVTVNIVAPDGSTVASSSVPV